MKISPISVTRNNFCSVKRNAFQNNYKSTPANTKVSFMGAFSLADINATILNSKNLKSYTFCHKLIVFLL